MGDRGNIVIVDGNDPPIYIYAHSNRYRLPQLLANALDTDQAKARLGDGSYLTRIVFCQIMKQVDDLDGETGWGISTTPCDGDETLRLDVNSGAVDVIGVGMLKLADFIATYKNSDEEF